MVNMHFNFDLFNKCDEKFYFIQFNVVAYIYGKIGYGTFQTWSLLSVLVSKSPDLLDSTYGFSVAMINESAVVSDPEKC
jgi:hypothetical protein